MDHWQEILWQQFGAAIDMLANAIEVCPEELWSDRGRRPEFWYLAFHTAFYLDCYNSPALEGFAPPPPFTLGELEEDVLPERVYTKAELLDYVANGRRKCREAIAALSEETARQRAGFDWLNLSRAEMLLYNLRHVQHHTAQLNLILRQVTDSAPRWVGRALRDRGGRA